MRGSTSTSRNPDTVRKIQTIIGCAVLCATGFLTADARGQNLPRLLLNPDKIEIQPGEVLLIKQLYTPANPFGGGTMSILSTGLPCVSCAVKDPSIARVRYEPSMNCYLPPDFKGSSAMPRGIEPAATLIEGLKEGATRVTATVTDKSRRTVEASAEVRVTKDSPRLAIVSPRWGDTFVKGAKNTLAWRCLGCKRDDRTAVGIHADDESSPGGLVAQDQPPNGTLTWDARRACFPKAVDPNAECYDLRPGHYWMSAFVQVDESGVSRGAPASGAAFSIVLPADTSPASVGPNSVIGTVAGMEFGVASVPTGLWLLTAADGKRLVCLTASTRVSIANVVASEAGPPITFTQEDLVFRFDVEAVGTWQDAHYVSCDGKRRDSHAPPLLEAKEIRLFASGVFGLVWECKDLSRADTCTTASNRYIEVVKFPPGGPDLPVAQTGRGNGRYLIALPPGHYFVLDRSFEVKPGQWTRLDLRELPPPLLH